MPKQESCKSKYIAMKGMLSQQLHRKGTNFVLITMEAEQWQK